MRFLTCIIILFLFTSESFSDSWALPRTEIYQSENKKFELTIHPRDHEIKVSKPRALLRRTGHADDILWQGELINSVAPLRALVTNNGKYFVTFDNWYSAGSGKVVVVYGSSQKPIKAFSLNELISEEHIQTLPRSISSIWWSGKHWITEDNKFLVLNIVAKNSSRDTPSYIVKFVNLETGELKERNR